MTFLRAALPGLLLGFSLGWIGFGDYGELHRMFTFEDLRLMAVFGGGVALGIPLLWLGGERFQLRYKPLTPGVLWGSVLFGVGWVLTGACPGVVLVQLGEGRMIALISLAGVLVGSALYPHVHQRYFGWETSTCG